MWWLQEARILSLNFVFKMPVFLVAMEKEKVKKYYYTTAQAEAWPHRFKTIIAKPGPFQKCSFSVDCNFLVSKSVGTVSWNESDQQVLA